MNVLLGHLPVIESLAHVAWMEVMRKDAVSTVMHSYECLNLSSDARNF